jgi:nucleoside-diphosphate-sugar epimerase
MSQKPLNFVDSHDVAKLVADLIKAPQPPHNEYNIASEETPTLKEFYDLIVLLY